MWPIGDESPRRTTPFVVYGLVAANVAAFAATLADGSRGADTVTKWGFTAAHFSVLTLFTSMFLHGGIFHIVGNMLYLWIFGDNVEDALGHFGFLAFYIAMGLAAGLGQYAANPDAVRPLVGASGAVSGVLGAYLMLFPNNRIKMLFWWYFYMRVFYMRAVWVLGFFFVMQVLYGAITGAASNVAYWAHVAGFLTGVAVAGLLLAFGVVKKPIAAAAPIRQGRRPVRLPDAETLRPATDADYLEVEPAAAAREGPRQAPEEAFAGAAGDDAAGRAEAIVAAVSSGELSKALAMTRVEMHKAGLRASPPTSLVAIADAFYQRKVHGVAFELYGEFIRRAPAGDFRLPEVKFRAGMVAARHLRDYEAARAFLSDVARCHGREERRALAEKEVETVNARLAVVAVQSEDALVSSPCAIVRRTAGPINLPEVGALVARESGKALADVTRLLRASVGFVATDLEPLKAKSVAARLQEMGVPVLVIPADKLVALPMAREARWAGVRPDGIQLGAAGDGSAPAPRKWEEVFFASIGKVVTEKNRPSPFGPEQHHRGQFMDVPIQGDFAVERSEKLVFDIFTLNPFQCFRLTSESASTAYAGPNGEARLQRNFARLVSDFVACGASVPTNGGPVLAALDAPARRWKGLTFDSIYDFDCYNYWRLQLEQYG